MSDVSSLYQDIILDHYRERHHAGLREGFDSEVHHVNPSCGDELTLRVQTRDGLVTDVSYQAEGCSISQASTSILTDLVIGRSVDDSLALYEDFRAMLDDRSGDEPNELRLEDAIAFAGVAQFPARVKCALLGWAAFKDALIRAEGNKDD